MIIYFETVEIQIKDIPQVLSNLGFAVQSVNLQITMEKFQREVCDKVIDVLKQKKADYAISYDFVPTIAQACLEANIPYISWVYDDPQQELYTQYVHYPSNYIFVFDRQQQRRLEQIGIRNVYHMPLAIYGDKVKQALQQDEKYTGQYEADIAFVGQLYHNDSLEHFVEQAASNVQTEMRESIERCFLTWDGQNGMHGGMSDSCVQYFSKIGGHKVERMYPYCTEQFYYEAAVLSRMLASRERAAVLNALAEKYDVNFYTFDKDVKGLNERVKVRPGAKYDTEVSHVYRQSKINLNITLHCIETGISQRVFDVMAAGGFLLSNYQEELEELFVPGEDLIIYHNMEELQYYVAYYLEHEEERQRIAKNGQAKVLELHDFHTRMSQVLDIVKEEDSKRVGNYLEQWNQIKPETEMMKDLTSCRNVEIRLGTNQLFQGMDGMEAAKDKYFELWERLSRITERSEATEYSDISRVIAEKKITSLYVAWHIFAKKQGKEAVLLKLCDSMKQYRYVTAIELVSYGLLMKPGASALLLKKAECLMEMSLWAEALDTLRQIREPQNEILTLIQTLERML